jgi:hypothetical protein
MRAFSRLIRQCTLGLSISIASVPVLAQSQPAVPPSPPAGVPAQGERKALSETLTGIARAEYEAGRVLYAEADYAGALVKFKAAYDVAKDPRLLWNMAACEKGLRRYARVYELVQRYRKEGAAVLSDADRDEAASLLEAIKPFVGWLRIGVNEPDAVVAIDEQDVGKSPLPDPLLVDIGMRRLRVTKPDFKPFGRAIEVTGGGEIQVTIQLEKEIHEGRLVIFAGPRDAIEVDGKVVGVGEFDGTVPSGAHRIRVTARGMRPYQSEVVVQDAQRASVRVALEPEPVAPVVFTPAAKDQGGGSPWLWIAGGAAVAAGLGVGAYFLFRPEDQPAEPMPGSLTTIRL